MPKQALNLKLETPVQVRMNKELLKKIDAQATKYGLGRGAFIRMVIIDWFDMRGSIRQISKKA